MLTLALDASTSSATAALVRDGIVIAATESDETGSRAELLMPAVERLLGAAGVGAGDLECIACGAGPGRFTSLRIAASIAKGIASVRGLPLIAAPSPLLVVAAANGLAPGGWLAILDAMRGDVFAQQVSVGVEGTLRAAGGPRLVSRVAAEAWGREQHLRLVGPEEAERRRPHALGFARLGRAGLGSTVDLATWEPDYGRKAEAQVRWEAAHGRALEST